LQNDQRNMEIAAAFVPPDNSTGAHWIFFAPIACACIGAGLEIISFLVEQLQVSRAKKKEKAMDEAWEKSTEKLQFSQHVLPEYVDEDQPSDEVRRPMTNESFLKQLQEKGLLTSEEVQACSQKLNEDDPRLLGLMDSHQRGLTRAAQEVKKKIEAARGLRPGEVFVDAPASEFQF